MGKESLDKEGTGEAEGDRKGISRIKLDSNNPITPCDNWISNDLGLK